MSDFVLTNIRKPKSYNNLKQLQAYNFGTCENDTFLNYLRKDTLCVNFNSLDEVFQLVGKLNGLKLKGDSSHKINYNSWTVHKTFEESLSELRNNPKSVVSFTPNDVSINDISESGNDVYYDVTGDYLDIGRYLDGVPESFGNMTMGSYRGVRVKIIYDASASYSVKAEQINERSKRLCRLVDWLEAQSIRVSLNAIYSSECGHFDIKVKDYSEPLNIYDVGVVSSSDFFRRLVFRLLECSKALDSGYGSSVAFSNRVTTDLMPSPVDQQELVLYITNYMVKYLDDINSGFDAIEEYISLLLPTGDYKLTINDRQIPLLLNKLKEVV